MKTKRGDLFILRCSTETCDGTHAMVQIGEHGEFPYADHVTDVEGLRQIAATCCELAAEIEALGGGPRRPH